VSQSLKEKTAKGLFWGGLSNGVQQLLNLVFGIFLARILDADDYGMVGMLTIFTLIANTLQESGFTAAIANKKEVTHKDYNAVFWFSTFAGFILYMILFFCAPLIAAFYGQPELIPLARFSFLTLLISSFGIAPRALLFRNLRTRESAIASVTALSISGIAGIILAYNGMSYWGIAIQTFIFATVVMLLSWYFAKWKPALSIDFTPLRKMIGFSSKLLITTLFMHINNNLFSFLFGKFFTAVEVGNYTQANKWNTMGHSFISGSIQNVAQPVLAQVREEAGRQKNIFRKMLRFTAFISFPLMLGLSLISHELIVITITEKWLAAAAILQILCIDGAFNPVMKLYTHLIISKGKSGIFMWNTITLSIVQLAVMLMLHPYGVRPMIIAFVIINTLWLTVWHYFAWREIRITCREALKDTLPFALIAALAMAVAYLITRNIENIYLLCLSKVVIAVPLYIGTLRLLNANILKECMGFLKKKPVKTP
jgi:O-antigen/teichoic acid export membrane protein